MPTNLKAKVIEGAEILRQILTTLPTQQALSTSIPNQCYEKWIMRAKEIHQVLSCTVDLFSIRDKAWETVQTLAESARTLTNPATDKVRYADLEMDFSVARHLSLLSYVTTSWSIYDRLANSCGRLSGTTNISENRGRNPNVFADFLEKKETLGFSCNQIIQKAYAWPIKVSYKVRNWLVHEGEEAGGVEFFRGSRASDGFYLHDKAIEFLQNICCFSEDNGKINSSCICAAEECWNSKDLLRILPLYHREVDEMFSALVEWSASSFLLQTKCFTNRNT